MAKIVQVPYKSDIVLPVETAQAVQENRGNPISLEALGLLVNLLSYPTSWELHKTELYKRFGKNKRTSVKSAWNDLVEANYIIEFRYRSGKSYEYVYYFRKVPFTSEEKTAILDNAKKEYGEIWGVDFVQPKLDTSKSTGNQIPKYNKKPLLNNNKLDIRNIDDDKRNTSQHNEESIQLIISNFRAATKDYLTDRSFNAVVRKVVDKYNQGKINSFRDYLATALTRKIEELELRRLKENTKQKKNVPPTAVISNKLQQMSIESIPFYNWLEE